MKTTLLALSALSGSIALADDNKYCDKDMYEVLKGFEYSGIFC